MRAVPLLSLAAVKNLLLPPHLVDRLAMATTLSGLIVSASPQRLLSDNPPLPNSHAKLLAFPLPQGLRRRRLPVLVASAPSTPPDISEKVAQSIKNAEQTCAEDAASGECAAAWDEVEELSAAASHARDKLKDVDPLEAFCKDNPETEECRTYED